MRINGRRFPFVFRTWGRIGRNYVVTLGFQVLEHEWGLSLYWGCRLAMGEDVEQGEMRFADGVRLTFPVIWKR